MVDPELDELKREFLSEAQDKVREIQTALERGRSPEALHRVAYIAHQLKGSGGSYGYQRISAEAAEIERVAENESGDGSESRIQQHVVNLRDEIERRARELH
jgi:HPt (histidine-containing phosphotransfer) domain-containing protein